VGNTGLALALLVSTAAGVAVLLPWLSGDTPCPWQTILGYGFACGQVLTTLVIRACFAAKLGLSFGATATVLAFIATVGLALALWIRKRRKVTAALVQFQIQMPEQGWRRWAWLLFVALILVRLTGLALEAWWRPLFPWDAWEIWGPKTKIWFESGDLNNFYGHFDNGYPPAINLIQIWANLGLGAWDDAKMNIAWPLLLGALALGGYGQALRLGASPLSAAIVSYLLVSAPILDAHAALAGYADLPLAVVFGLAAIAFFAWAITNDTRQLVLSIAFASMAPLFKIPGVIWSLMLVPGILVAFFQRSSGVKALRWAAAAVVAGLIAAAYLYAKQRNFALTLYQAHVEPNAASGFVFDNYFLLDNYHLLWYFVVAALVVWWRHALSSTLRPATAFVAACVAFLAVSFFFTNSAEWWGDYGSINRATIHLVPALVFYLFLISRGSTSLNKTTLPT
jgi:hypothetical protein